MKLVRDQFTEQGGSSNETSSSVTLKGVNCQSARAPGRFDHLHHLATSARKYAALPGRADRGTAPAPETARISGSHPARTTHSGRVYPAGIRPASQGVPVPLRKPDKFPDGRQIGAIGLSFAMLMEREQPPAIRLRQHRKAFAT